MHEYGAVEQGEQLVAYLDPGGQRLMQLQTMDVDADVVDVRRQLRSLRDSEPPPEGVDALYFGLFDTQSESGNQGLAYYVAGVRGFKPEQPESLVAPAWFPENRFLSSRTLAELKRAEVQASADGDGEWEQMLGYAGQLGVALLISRFVAEDVAPGTRCVVGFDSGDFATTDA